ncbi:MAG: hypothetical protein ACYC0X_30745 [Pirellulaceae bacterium]
MDSATELPAAALFNPQPKARKQIVPIPAETSRILAFGCGLNNDGATAYGAIRGRLIFAAKRQPIFSTLTEMSQTHFRPSVWHWQPDSE